MPPNKLGRSVLFSECLGFQNFEKGIADLCHNSCDVLCIMSCVPGTVPGASHTFAP